MTRPLIFFNLVFMLFSCKSESEKWKKEWNQHQSEFKEIVGLIKAKKLNVVYGRMGYEIPDTFDLQSTCGQIVFRETDFTYDSSYSILFRLSLDTSAVLRADPMIVYTDNDKRLKEYESGDGNVFKIETNWYFVNR